MPEGRPAVALGDVSGKSVPAALLMSNVISTLRAEARHEVEVDRSLEHINQLLVEQTEPGRFVTLFYGIFDPSAGRLRYSSAGHSPVLRIGAARPGGVAAEGGLPLGVSADARYPPPRRRSRPATSSSSTRTASPKPSARAATA